MITVDQIMSKNPCAGYDRTRVEDLVGTGLTPQGVAVADIPAQDRLWTLVTCAMNKEQRSQFACSCAEQALTLATQPDPRSTAAVATARQYLAGTATKPDLVAARVSANTTILSADSPVLAETAALEAVSAVLAPSLTATASTANAAFRAGATWEWQLAQALTIVEAP